MRDKPETAPLPQGVLAPGALSEETLATSHTRRKVGRGVIVGLQILTFVVLMGAWQVLSAVNILDPFFFSRPSDIALRMWEWIATGFIWQHLATTLIEAILAFVFDPYIRILNALPRVILAPIFLLWFGLGIASKVALGVTLVFFIVFFSTYQGVREVDPVVLNNARMLQASDRHLMRYVYLPSVMAWIFSSLHTSIGFALAGAVVGEYLGSARGIGYVVAQAEGVFDTTGVFAGLILTSAVVLCIDLGIERLERYLLRWRPTAA
jgi:NitT/TauT family transport system permease protein